jgi:RNA polymerase sigma factor (sigma-70 family)
VADRSGEPEQLVDKESARRIRQRALIEMVVADWDEQIRSICKLHWFESWTIRGIARRMGTSHGTVERRLNEGREKLKKELEPLEKWLFEP